MKFLVINGSDFERQIIATFLESKYDARIVEASSGSDAIRIIKQDASFDCIISDYEMENGTGGDVFKYIKNERLSIPYILCTDKKLEDHSEFFGQEIIGAINKSAIVQNLSRLLGSFTKNASFRRDAITHCRINLSVLRKINFVNCDLYLKISDAKFVKIKNKDDPVDSELFAKYEKKNVDSFFILRKDADEFTAYLEKNVSGVESLSQASLDIKSNIFELNNSMKKANEQEAALDSVFKISRAAQEQAHVAIKKLGLTRDVEALIKSSVHSTVRTINQNPRLSELFGAAIKNGGEYYATHSTLLSYIAAAIAVQMGWDSDFTRYKLSLAAFLHDIWLDEKLARCQSLAEILMDGNRFSKEEADLFSSHPQKAADLVREISELPPDIDRIVLEHHERPNGTGFPSRLNHSQFGPLSCIFIVAHDLVNFVLEQEGRPWSIDGFLGQFGSEYSVGHFKKIRLNLSKMVIS